jgi:predicted PurR-regulated permease PerM
MALAIVAALAALVVPIAIHQLDQTVGVQPRPAALDKAAARAHGIEAPALRVTANALRRFRANSDIFGAGQRATRRGLAILAAIGFTFGFAVFWLSERRRLLSLLIRLAPVRSRRTLLNAWEECESKLGSYLRRVLVMLVVVSGVLSLAYSLLGVPYAIILGPFSGTVELVPVIGPFLAGGAAVLAALTVSGKLAAATLAVFLAFRLFQDYVINPRLIGGGIGVPPLVVLTAAAAVGLLLGPVAVVIATPLAAVAVVVFDVAVHRDAPRDRSHAPSR